MGYRPKVSADGGWSAWSAWSSCDVDCSRNRSRECSNPSPFHGGADCPGNTTEEAGCCGDACTGNYGVFYIENFVTCMFHPESSLYVGCYSNSDIVADQMELPLMTVCSCVSYCR